MRILRNGCTLHPVPVCLALIACSIAAVSFAVYAWGGVATCDGKGESRDTALKRIEAALDSSDASTDPEYVREILRELIQSQRSGSKVVDGDCWQVCPICGTREPHIERSGSPWDAHGPARNGHVDGCEYWQTMGAIARREQMLRRVSGGRSDSVRQ